MRIFFFTCLLQSLDCNKIYNCIYDGEDNYTLKFLITINLFDSKFREEIMGPNAHARVRLILKRLA